MIFQSEVNSVSWVKDDGGRGPHPEYLQQLSRTAPSLIRTGTGRDSGSKGVRWDRCRHECEQWEFPGGLGGTAPRTTSRGRAGSSGGSPLPPSPPMVPQCRCGSSHLRRFSPPWGLQRLHSGSGYLWGRLRRCGLKEGLGFHNGCWSY